MQFHIPVLSILTCKSRQSVVCRLNCYSIYHIIAKTDCIYPMFYDTIEQE